MKFTTTLLAGAAICALCTAPALSSATPLAHLKGIDTRFKTIHEKTAHVSPNLTDVTATLTLSYSFSTASLMNIPTLLYAYTWVAPSCLPPKKESFKTAKKTKVAKLSMGSTTGSVGCSNTFTFYGPVYDLKKSATSDYFPGTLIAKKYDGYDYTAYFNTYLYFF